MEVDVEAPPVERARLRDALLALATVAPDLDIPAGESNSWHAAADALSDPVLVMLAGATGGGKTLLASALSGVALEEGDEVDSAPVPLIFWKYGQRPAEVRDGGLLECYRPEKALTDCAFLEVAESAFGGGGLLAERAYALADVVLLVFSADDPWGKGGWEFLRRIHKRRERPVAAVVTHIDGRTGEELDAIVDYLSGTSRAALADAVPVFTVTSVARLAARDRVPELGAWISAAAEGRPAARQRLERAERALMQGAETVARALVDSVDDTDAEAECVSWMDVEIVRERDRVLAEAAGAMAPAREGYQDLTARGRGRLSRALGIFGLPLTLARGASWVKAAQSAATDAAGQRAEDGARQVVEKTGARLAQLSERTGEKVAGVFGGDVAEQLPEPPDIGDAREIGRRASARVREAAGDREAGVAVAAMVGNYRLWLLLIAVLLAGTLIAAWRFQRIGETGVAMLCGGGAIAQVLWGAVLLRSRRNAILARYDSETGAAREAVGRDLESVYRPQIEAAFNRYSEGLEALRERAKALAAERSDLRARVLQAIEFASERRHNSAL